MDSGHWWRCSTSSSDARRIWPEGGVEEPAMADDQDRLGRRRPWTIGPETVAAVAEDWLALSDDELLFRIEALPADHQADGRLIAVVQSARHFFVRQEAAKKIHDREL